MARQRHCLAAAPRRARSAASSKVRAWTIAANSCLCLPVCHWTVLWHGYFRRQRTAVIVAGSNTFARRPGPFPPCVLGNGLRDCRFIDYCCAVRSVASDVSVICYRWAADCMLLDAGWTAVYSLDSLPRIGNPGLLKCDCPPARTSDPHSLVPHFLCLFQTIALQKPWNSFQELRQSSIKVQ